MYFRLLSFARQHRWSIGIAIAATPTVAILQGALMLQDFRKHHGDAPIPVSPSRGIVVMKKTTSNNGRQVTSKNFQVDNDEDNDNNYQLKPLRLLVIGDSLAAGVGVSTQGTPILPESIAKSLSHACGGRAVRWTCVGTPGATAAQIVQDIVTFDEYNDDDDNNDDNTDGRNDEYSATTASTNRPSMLEQKLVEWQETKKRAQEWLEERKQKQDEEEREQKMHQQKQNTANKIEQWWSRVRNDVSSFRKNVMRINDTTQGKRQQTTMHERRLSRRRISLRQGQRRHGVDASEYDIAIVLTGLNDLKDLVLPFMTTGKNAGASQEAQREASRDGLKGELLRVLQALKDKMKLQLPTTTKDQKHGNDGPATNNVDQETLSTSSSKTSHTSTISSQQSQPHEQEQEQRQFGPLVVFPSLPIAPLPLCQRAPLSWFAVPLLTMMDNHKRRLADKFPNLVLFVESPSMKSVEDMEAGRGQILEFKKGEQVLLLLSDVTELARNKVEKLMREHYHGKDTSNQQKSTEVDGENSDANHHLTRRPKTEAQQQDVYHVGCHDHLPASNETPPGSSLVAADNVHPNDAGYDFWGRHIAAAIVAEWEKRKNQSSR